MAGNGYSVDDILEEIRRKKENGAEKSTVSETKKDHSEQKGDFFEMRQKNAKPEEEKTPEAPTYTKKFKEEPITTRTIHYDEPSDAQHPLSFVVDEIKPVSRWKEFGYASPQAAAQDWNNLQAAHYVCNAAKSNKVGFEFACGTTKTDEPDGEW